MWQGRGLKPFQRPPPHTQDAIRRHFQVSSCTHSTDRPSARPFATFHAQPPRHFSHLSVSPTPPPLLPLPFILICACQFFPQCAFNAYSLHPWDYRGDREQAQYVPGDFLVHFAGKKGMKKVHLMEHYLAVVERTYGGQEGGIVSGAA